MHPIKNPMDKTVLELPFTSLYQLNFRAQGPIIIFCFKINKPCLKYLKKHFQFRTREKNTNIIIANMN